MNLLFLDTETTGLSEYKNDVIQIACVAVLDGEEHGEFNEFGQPIHWENIDEEAIRIHGIDRDQMRTFQPQEQLLDNFIKFVKSLGVRFSLAGHNCSFDRKMLSGLFQRHGKSSDFFSIFDLNTHDTLPRARALKGKLKAENNKLETLAKFFKIEINAHDALSDIRATIQVDKELSKLMGENTDAYKPTVQQDKIEVELPEPAQLHLHSQYTMIDAVVTPEEWADWCIENKIPGYSVVDHGYAISLFNAIRNDNTKTVCVPGVGLNFKVNLSDEEFFHLNAWATSNDGYFNLMKLSSIGFENAIEKNKIIIPILTLEQINKYRNGIKFGSADIDGYVGRAVKVGDYELAESRFKYLDKLFGDDMFFELNPIDITYQFDKSIGFKKVESNVLVNNCNRQEALNRFLMEMYLTGDSKYNFIPVTGACFINKDDKILQDCLCKNGYDDGRYYQESYHAKRSNEIYNGLKCHLGSLLTVNIYKKWVDNSYKITELAKSIKVEFSYHLPKIDIPADIQALSSSYDEQVYLLTLRKIKEYGRWNDSQEYKKRFKKEIDVIKNNKAMNFLPYFLVYEDLGRFAREAGFLQNIGRGSAGGSLLSYYLKIIHVDPIRKNLPFERFLSHARINAGSWPDIDMDIAKNARPYLMKYMLEKYGTGFAQVATFSTMKTKNAIKDSMWALYGRNRNDFEIDAVCKTIPDSPQGTPEYDFLYGYTDSEGEYHRGQLEDNEMLQNFFKTYVDVEKMVRRLIGVVRGLSRHASAFVVSTLDLPGQRCPTMMMYDKGMGASIYVTQYDGKMCEKTDLVKADILGLKTLSVLTDAIKSIKSADYLQTDSKGMQLIYDLPEDEAVYVDFFNKKTDSSFQFNTPLIKGYLQEFTPSVREDLAILTSLCRPGALDAPMGDTTATQYYLDVRNGRRDPEYVHSDLAAILKDTNGVFVYQEQVLRFLVEIADYSWEESDMVRSAIAKKKHAVIMAAFDRIREATIKRGWTLDQANTICHQIQAFSSYSFNLSHASAYAELGYITMYLKHHHKLEWWCAVLNNEDDEDKLRHYVSILGDLIKPPTISNPNDKFVIRKDKIVAPVSIVKGVGPKAYEELATKGPFKNLSDYCERIDHRKVDIGAVSQLIKARVMDDFMDQTLPYGEARLKFMVDYKKERGNIKSNFKEELNSTDPLEMFLMEKEANTTFNKSVLSDPLLFDIISNRWPGLKKTGRAGIPFIMGDAPVLNNINVASGFVDKKYEKEVALICLFNGSEVLKGVSKKSGKDYCFVKVIFTDGFIDFEGVDFNRKTPLKLPINSLVYIRGTIKAGWKVPISINIQEIEQIQ